MNTLKKSWIIHNINIYLFKMYGDKIIFQNKRMKYWQLLNAQHLLWWQMTESSDLVWSTVIFPQISNICVKHLMTMMKSTTMIIRYTETLTFKWNIQYLSETNILNIIEFWRFPLSRFSVSASAASFHILLEIYEVTNPSFPQIILKTCILPN